MPRAAQLYIGDAPMSNVAPGSIDPETGRLVGVHENGPTQNNTLIVGGAGADRVALEVMMNTTLDIMQKHAGPGGGVDWQAIAQENTNVGDHWVDILGVNVWADFNRAEGDDILVRGHTVKVDIEYKDINRDGDLESILTLTSADMRNGAPQAHVHDWLGVLIVDGDMVTQDDITVDPMTFHNLVGNITERGDVAEARFPNGAPAHFEVDGETIIGYDTRYREDDPITGNIEYYFQNKYIDEIPGLIPDGPPPSGANSQPEPGPAVSQQTVDLEALVEQLVREFNGDEEAIRIRNEGKVLRGAETEDLVVGDAATTKLHGHRGDDLVIGGDSQGIAKLKGGKGDDIIVGGAGDDRLYGNDGADVFAFGLGSDKDRIIDFSAAEGDKIDLTAAGFETFDEVTSAATDLTGRVAITAEDGSVLVLKDFQTEDLRESWFELA